MFFWEKHEWGFLLRAPYDTPAPVTTRDRDREREREESKSEEKAADHGGGGVSSTHYSLRIGAR